MNIVLSPNPTLRKVCDVCIPEDRSLQKLAKKMAQTMYKNDGCGLAAPQVGVLKRLIVVDCDEERKKNNPIILINPEIILLEGDLVKAEEGCLSCPGISVVIERQPFVKVSYFDLSGEEWTIEGEGLLGRCLQHEIDHLDGITLFERCDPLERLGAVRAYEEALALGAKPGDTSVEPRIR